MRWIVVILFLFLTGFTVFCVTETSFLDSLKEIWAKVWGKQILFDLYIGFTLVSLVYFLNEKSIGRAMLWMLATFAFGNIASLVYLLLNFRSIEAMISRIRSPLA
ncbi:hypothetical protein L0222_10835 [bacterium]|nr:hypothetical protein [bacterium]